VASMKGVILETNPHCVLVDITHQVKPHDIEEGLLSWRMPVPSFRRGRFMYRLWTRESGPEKANPHCDPGLLLSGPDNGLLSLAAQGKR